MNAWCTAANFGKRLIKAPKLYLGVMGKARYSRPVADGQKRRAIAGIPLVDPAVEPSRFQRAMHAIGMSARGRWYGINVSSRIDPLLLRLTRGRFATTTFFPLVLLTVRGRKSGKPRTVPLVYFTEGDEVILTASSFGRARHPAWYLNVKANPHMELSARGKRAHFVARETQGEERDRLFELYARGINLTANCRGVLAAPVLAELGFTDIHREYMAQMTFPTEIVTARSP